MFLLTAPACAPTAVPPAAIAAPRRRRRRYSNGCPCGRMLLGRSSRVSARAGVESLVSGYADGSAETANYEKDPGC